MGETNFTLGSNPNVHFLFIDTGLFFPRIRPLLTTFKDVLIAVDMTKELKEHNTTTNKNKLDLRI